MQNCLIESLVFICIIHHGRSFSSFQIEGKAAVEIHKEAFIRLLCAFVISTTLHKRKQQQQSFFFR
jgi:hypothetical protein